MAAREPSEYDSYTAIVRRIPRGRVMTYGDVAAAAGRPSFARRVGYALHALRDPEVPWWRVVNARGAVSFRSGSALGEDEDEQRFLLSRDGVELDDEGRVDLARYRWRPRGKRS